MRKKLLFLTIFFALQMLSAQTTETFETESSNSTSFTDNGQIFNITSQAQGPFNIQASFPGTGWNGSSVDNRYIDNDGSAVTNTPVQFTITAAGGANFNLKSIYLYLATAYNSLSVTGSCTITGKLAGSTVFTATQSSGFNSSFGINNGFTFINMSTYGGADNSTASIDSYVVTTTGTIAYVSLDAMRWQAVSTCPAVTVSPFSQTNIACNGGSIGAASVSASGGSGFTYNWTPGNPTGDGTASITGVPAGTWTCTVTNSCGNSNSYAFTITEPTTAITLNPLSQTNIACNGGSTGAAAVNAATGGTAPYTYNWTPGNPTGDGTTSISGVPAGTWTVTATDANGCTATQSFTVTQPPALALTPASQTNIACNGGSTGAASVNAATGGTAPYTYNWSPGNPTGDGTISISGVPAGTWTVTATDANGCTATQSFTVTQPPAFTVGTSQTNISCNGGTNGTATVTVTGATGPYTYAWAPSGGTAATASGLAAGNYTVTITDANNCQTTRNFTITQPPAFTVGASQTNISCNGGTNGTATVTVTGATGPYTYAWAPSGGTAATASGLGAGNYTVTITDANSCQATRNFTITQPPAFTVGTSQTNISCNGGTNGTATVTVTGATGPYTYAWAPSGGTAATASGLGAGNYTVTITDANSCQTTRNFTITQPPAFTVGTSQTNISCNGGTNGTATVTVTGATGPYTYAWAPSGGTAATASGLGAGNYTVTITDANSCQTTRNFTITQPPAFTVGTSQTNISCNGGTNGTATVTVTGATGPYTYAWAPSGGTAATASGLAAGNYTVTITDANNCQTTRNFTITQPPAFTVGTSQTNISCNGGTNGTATVTVTGATGPYTYAWVPSGGTAATASGLGAGNYTVTITDANNCQTTRNFTITQPPAFTVGTSQTNISCNGGTNGTATVTVTGATGPYTYAWAPSGGTAATASGLGAGNYTVTITDANSCQATRNFTITQPPAFTVGTSQTNISCNGGTNGTATVTVTGATGPYTYAWAPSGGTAATATGLAAGTYTVTVRDANNCTDTQSFTITQPPVLNATAGTQTNVSCNGGTNGSATVNVTGGTGTYTYAWAPSGGTAATATGLAAGTYTVTVRDANNCTDTQSFTITQPPVLNATAGTQTNVSCNGGTNGSATVNVTGGTGTYTYAWAPSGGTAATATGLAAGTYTVTVRDANNCTDTQSFTITQPPVLNATAGTQTNVSCNGGTNGSATVNVTGGTGTYTYAWAPSGGTAATATGLATGTYTVTVRDANNCTDTQSFTITQPPVLGASAAQDFPATCAENNDGGATATATGGTNPYSYAWDNGASTAVVTNLSVGSHTVTVTDANGCTATANVTISFSDTVDPVPTVANLPGISMQCQVLASDVPVPTATDNCTGTITVTNDAVFPITLQGTTVITWIYEDVNGNIATQTQNITVTESAINAVTFTGQTVVYNTAAQAIAVDNLPAGASVAYSINPDTGLGNAAIDVGVYTVTAVVSPADDAPNCDPITLTATLTIEQAEQQIVFDALPVKNLEADPDFQLTAAATSGLPVYYTYTFTAPTTPATVTPAGWVDMLASGTIEITAHQDGDSNYLPATPVTQELVITSSDAGIHTITIGETEYTNPGQDIYNLIVCEDTASSVTVSIVTEANATVTPGHAFTIDTPQPGIYQQTVTVTSEDGTVTQTYTVTVEKMFQFFDIAVQKFDNLLLVNNNPSTNGGYSFVGYEWYKNGQLVGRKQYFSEGPTSNDLLDPDAEYYLKVTTAEGEVLQTCIGQITLEHSYRMSVIPNPAVIGSELSVIVDFPAKEINDMRIDIHDINGRIVHTSYSSQRITPVSLSGSIEAGVYIVTCTTENHRKSFKIIVRK